MGRSELSTSVVKWSDMQCSEVKILGKLCLSLLEDIQIVRSLLLLHILLVIFCAIVYMVTCFVYFYLRF
jgi:hypothetical protein